MIMKERGSEKGGLEVVKAMRPGGVVARERRQSRRILCIQQSVVVSRHLSI